MKKLLLLTITILFIASNQQLAAQNHKEENVDFELRSAWINNNVKLLKDFDKQAIEKKVVLKKFEENGEIHQSYRINKKGFIEFEGQDWVYIILHSSHNKDKIGDVAIARDQNGDIYIHLGHNCGMIAHYQVKSTVLFTKSKDFFEHFKSDIDTLSWKRYK